MKKQETKLSRRSFMATMGAATASIAVAKPTNPFGSQRAIRKKTRLAIIGTGVRACGMYGRDLLRDYGDVIDIVGLCDINPGRVAYAKSYIGASCSTFANLDRMLKQTNPDVLLVTTVDSIHHEHIIQGLNAGIAVITEKPMTTDETKAQAILDAVKRAGRDIVVTFNYRYSPHRARIKELLQDNVIGKLTSVDFNWYLDTEHGPRYMRRWHGLREKGGTLLVHKSTHHFDLLNWWLDTDPETVSAVGALEFFGRNNEFRSTKCRGCPHQNKCELHWDIRTNQHLYKLYAENEHHDGYIRDSCVWREEIDIYDKMGVLVTYANGVQATYSLTTYSPYEGYRIAFNGTRGRLECWIQERQPWEAEEFDELRLTLNSGEMRLFRVPNTESGHGGGDRRMLDKLFRDPDMPDPLRQAAGSRDGAMSILTGIAARKSIETGKPVRIGSLTELQPQVVRPA